MKTPPVKVAIIFDDASLIMFQFRVIWCAIPDGYHAASNLIEKYSVFWFRKSSGRQPVTVWRFLRPHSTQFVNAVSLLKTVVNRCFAFHPGTNPFGGILATVHNVRCVTFVPALDLFRQDRVGSRRHRSNDKCRHQNENQDN